MRASGRFRYTLEMLLKQRRWEQDVPGNIARAVSHWPGVLNK